MSDWIPASAPPADGRPVLAHVVGLRQGDIGVIIRASYAPKHTLEWGGDPGEGDTDPETGSEYAPEGWYEHHEVECPECGESCDVHMTWPAKVTHWMFLPAKPGVDS